jgi:hypothetical protein
MESRLFLQKLDPSLLMWDMRRNVDTSHLPRHRCTIQFLYPELSASQKSWWIVVENGMVDLCNFDPGYELDLLVRSSLKSMTAIWISLSTVMQEADAHQLDVQGDPDLARTPYRSGLVLAFSQQYLVRRPKESLPAWCHTLD